MSSPGGSLYDETIKNGVSKLLQTQIIPGAVAAVDFSNLNTLGYDSLWWELNQLAPVVNGNLVMAVWVGGALQGSAYSAYGAEMILGNAGPPNYFGSTNVGGPWLAYFYIFSSHNASHPLSGRVRLLGNPAGAFYKTFLWTCAAYTSASGYNETWAGGGQWQGSGGQLQGIRFAYESGNIASGEFRMYGMRTGV